CFGTQQPPGGRVNQFKADTSGALNALKVSRNRKIHTHFLVSIGYVLDAFCLYLPRRDYLYGLRGCDFRQLGCDCLRKTFIKRRIVIIATPKWHHCSLLIGWNRMQLAIYPVRDSSALKPDDQSKDEYEDCHDR